MNNQGTYIRWDREWMIWSILLLPALMTAVYWNALPEQIPIHWNLRGEVDGYGPRYMLPLMNLGVYLLLTLAPLIDPRRNNYRRFVRTFFYLRVGIVLFLVALNFLSIYIALGYDLPAVRLIMAATFLLLALLGNYLSTVKPNYFIGFRLPWTLEDDEVWRATHRMAARLWFGLGMLGILFAFVLPLPLLLGAELGLIGILVFIPTVYAYRRYQQRHGNR